MKVWALKNERKASRFWRIEPWKEKLALIEIFPYYGVILREY